MRLEHKQDQMQLFSRVALVANTSPFISSMLSAVIARVRSNRIVRTQSKSLTFRMPHSCCERFPALWGYLATSVPLTTGDGKR